MLISSLGVCVAGMLKVTPDGSHFNEGQRDVELLSKSRGLVDLWILDNLSWYKVTLALTSS